MDKIHDLLKDIGVKADLCGYRYLHDAIEMTATSPDTMRSITKELYPAVAAIHGTTGSRVEKGIRHAITVAFERCPASVATKYFGNAISPAMGRPTNGQFIATMAREVAG